VRAKRERDISRRRGRPSDERERSRGGEGTGGERRRREGREDTIDDVFERNSIF